MQICKTRVVVGVACLIVHIGAWAQVRCTMPNGVVIEQKLSSKCPAGAIRAETMDGKPATTRPLTKVAPSPIVTDRRMVKSQDVSSDEFGGAWPLTVPRGTLRCMYPAPDRPQLTAHLIVVEGVFYALNGTAQSHADRMGWRRVESIWRESQAIPGTRVPLTPLRERAAKLC